MTLLDHKKLAVIHIVKRELNLSDQEYRDMLGQVAGVRSARDLDEKGFRRLMNAFTRSSQYQVNPYGLTLRQKLFIDHLVADLAWDQSHLHNFLNKYYKKSRVKELSKKEASKVIIALQKILHSQQPGSRRD
ncbi:phage protein GemA/Gp16 family protein [Desulfosediminicola flagellatus]|uniref:phage protein GemA/Gp16 family protein n=1 Tax=Desulfosediminicola flagellatus TaxID=2569541 RepID=UPI0010ACD71C|nr:phage protein GemA/Gp16 family protein [Desulfosediminicola flagellatus]